MESPLPWPPWLTGAPQAGALRQHSSLTGELGASVEHKQHPTTEGRLPGVGPVPSSVGKHHGLGLYAHFLFTFRGQVLIDHGRFGERRVLCDSESPLPSAWRRSNQALAGTWPWGKGSFVIKTKSRFLVFCSNQLSQALPPE